MAFAIRSRNLYWARQQSSVYQICFYQTRSSSFCYPCSWQTPLGVVARRSAMAFLSSADSDPLPLKNVPIEEVERLEKYQPGEYHPIMIGDVLQSRYRVIHKLGYGTYSTIWLCLDYQSNTYVAVKVGTAESSAREADVFEYLNHSSPFDHPGREMIPSVKGRFIVHGPNGPHPCYVTDLAMCSVSGAKDGSYRRIFQARTARSLVVQLVLAVKYLHSKGVVHGGRPTLFFLFFFSTIC